MTVRSLCRADWVALWPGQRRRLFARRVGTIQETLDVLMRRVAVRDGGASEGYRRCLFECGHQIAEREGGDGADLRRGVGVCRQVHQARDRQALHPTRNRRRVSIRRRAGSPCRGDEFLNHIREIRIGRIVRVKLNEAGGALMLKQFSDGEVGGKEAAAIGSKTGSVRLVNNSGGRRRSRTRAAESTRRCASG